MQPGKTKSDACWFISNCVARRNEMVKELQKDADVYGYTVGRSGTKKCLKNKRMTWQPKRTSFYMSLENSMYLDYITEK